MSDRILLSSPHMSDEGFEMEFIKEAFDTNWIAPYGNNIDEFEKEFADKAGAPYSVALSSGTSAIHLALKLAGVGENDIVFCQSLTFAATAFPIIYQGAKPVFIDSEIDTWNMDPDLLEKAFIKYPKTKAVVVVHLYGLSAKLDEIMKICKKYNAVLIEDAAESLGSTYKGKQTGTLAEYGIFSFNGNKIITTSGGGMLVTKTNEDRNKAKFWSTQAKEDTRHYEHYEVGYNYRMSNVVAGIGRGQLKILDRRVEKKKWIYNYYKKNLSDIKDIEFMPMNAWCDANCWITSILIKNKISPAQLIEILEENNIESRHLWKPMHLQPVFKDYDYFGNGVSDNLFETGICLPSDTKMNEEDLTRVVKIIRDLWN